MTYTPENQVPISDPQPEENNEFVIVTEQPPTIPENPDPSSQGYQYDNNQYNQGDSYDPYQAGKRSIYKSTLTQY